MFTDMAFTFEGATIMIYIDTIDGFHNIIIRDQFVENLYNFTHVTVCNHLTVWENFNFQLEITPMYTSPKEIKILQEFLEDLDLDIVL